MSTFKTTDGREWVVAVNVGTIKRVREMAAVNLLSLVGDVSAISAVFSDDVKLAEVVAAVVLPQLESCRQVPDDLFSVLDGSALEQAAEALLREIANFFQEPRRSVLLKAMEKVARATQAKNHAGAAAALEALETMEIEVPSAQTLTSCASSLPASAA